MLAQLHRIVDSELIPELGEDLTLEDEESEGVVPWSTIMKSWRINNLPELDSELLEFLKWLAIRHSEGSNKIYIQKFLEIFNEDYLISQSPFEDQQFQHSSPDQDDLTTESKPEEPQQENLAVDNHDELVFYVDQALCGIVAVLPS